MTRAVWKWSITVWLPCLVMGSKYPGLRSLLSIASAYGPTTTFDQPPNAPPQARSPAIYPQRIRHIEDALMRANKAEDLQDTAEQSWVIYFDLEDSGSFVIQDGELFREEPGGTYTPVGRVRK